MKDKSNREFIKELYNGMLRPIATRDEFDTWLAKVDRGSTWQEVLKEFTSSVEFHLRVQGIIDSVIGNRQVKTC
jgi:hypothetical protein